MSTNILRLIPTDPVHVPDPAARALALDRLARLVRDPAGVREVIHDQVAFIDCGANLDRIVCPHCDAGLPDDWWHDAVDAAHHGGFADLTCTPPCCGRPCSLNDLRYEWPMGFARYVLEAEDPGISDLKAADVRILRAVLGCPLRVIHARY